jgi:hypothetical protein
MDNTLSISEQRDRAIATFNAVADTADAAIRYVRYTDTVEYAPAREAAGNCERMAVDLLALAAREVRRFDAAPARVGKVRAGVTAHTYTLLARYLRARRSALRAHRLREPDHVVEALVVESVVA